MVAATTNPRIPTIPTVARASINEKARLSEEQREGFWSMCHDFHNNHFYQAEFTDIPLAADLIRNPENPG